MRLHPHSSHWVNFWLDIIFKIYYTCTMQMIRYKVGMTKIEMYNTLPEECRTAISTRLISCFESFEDFVENIKSKNGVKTIELELTGGVMVCACSMRSHGCTKRFIAEFFGYNEFTFHAFMKAGRIRLKTNRQKCGPELTMADMRTITRVWFKR